MLTFLPGPIVGVIAALLYLLNLICVPFLVIIVAIIQRITPIKSWRRALNYLLHVTLPDAWVKGNQLIGWLTTKTVWDVQGTGELHKKGWYFLISNHFSWLDILVLENIFGNKIPMLKFFMKKSLLWQLPIAGLGCWLLGYPFMERYSKDYLKKHPEKKGKDLEITRRACEKFKDQPITIISFVEGTRFSEEKKARQNSPYQYLLKPKAGSFAFVLSAMNGHLHDIINATIIYPDKDTTIWKFMCGKVKKIIVRYEVIPISAAHMGNYYEDTAFRIQFQNWLNQAWKEKDELIANTHNSIEHQ